MIGGMIAAAQIQAAKEAWGSQPEMRLYCAQKALARHKVTIPALIQNGVMPSDQRLAPIGSECAKFEPGNLKSKYRCNALDENGATVVSTCNQAFGQVDGAGIAQVIDARTAIDLYFADGSFLLVDVESDAGRQQRYRQAERQRLISDLTALRGSVESLQSSRSETVRAEAQKLNKRIASALGPKATVSSSDFETIRRDYKALAGFAGSENTRLAAMDNLNTVRSAAEQKISSEIPQSIQDDFNALQATYAEITQEASPAFSLEKTQFAIGPTFDCGKAKDPLGRIICSDKELSRLDVDLLRPYYVLRFSAPDQRNSLKQDAVAFTQSVLQTCGIPEKGTVSNAIIKKAVPCVATEYRRQRDQWQAQMAQAAPASAQDETGRPLDEHVQLQKLLQDMGYIPAAEKADGIYGAGTRTAISTFQTAENIAADGLLSEETAQRLFQRSTQPDAGGAGHGQVARLGDLAGRYVDLSGRIDRYMSQQARKRQLMETVAQAESYAKEKSALPLPAKIATALTGLVGEVERVRAVPDLEALELAAAKFKTVKETVDGAVSVLNATSAANRFVMEGGLNDIVVLYNDSGKAPSLVRNLKGDLVFQGSKSSVCQPHDGTPEKSFVKLVNARLESTGLQLSFPLPRCDMSDPGSYDLIVTTRGRLQEAEHPSDVVAILSAVDRGHFKSMLSVTEQDVGAILQAEAARALEIEKGVDGGTIQGFGLVLLQNGSGEVCLMTAEDQPAHELLLLSYSDRLNESLKAPQSSRMTSIEEAFIAAKRGQCGAVYGSRDDLKSITGALRRDQVSFSYPAIWVEPAQLVEAREQAVILAQQRAEAEAAAKAAAEAKAKADEEARRVAWEEAKAKAEAEKIRKAEEEARRLKGPAAASACASLVRGDKDGDPVMHTLTQLDSYDESEPGKITVRFQVGSARGSSCAMAAKAVCRINGSSVSIIEPWRISGYIPC